MGYLSPQLLLDSADIKQAVWQQEIQEVKVMVKCGQKVPSTGTLLAASIAPKVDDTG